MNTESNEKELTPSSQQKLRLYSSKIVTRGLDLADQICMVNSQFLRLSLSNKSSTSIDEIDHEYYEYAERINYSLSLGISEYVAGNQTHAASYFRDVSCIDKYHVSALALCVVIFADDECILLRSFLESLNQAIKIEPIFPIKIHVLYAQGIGLMAKKMSVEGSNILRSAATLEPDTQDIFASIDFFLRGCIHVLFHNYYLALEDFKKAIEINNTNVIALAYSGLIRQEKVGDYPG
jgi:tetratricopeptide (TPR) repeat protein